MGNKRENKFQSIHHDITCILTMRISVQLWVAMETQVQYVNVLEFEQLGPANVIMA